MEIRARPAPRTGITARKMRASWLFTPKAIIIEKIRVMGARTAMRIII